MKKFSVLVIFLILIIAGCSGHDNPTSLDLTESKPRVSVDSAGNMKILGMWNVRLDDSRQEISVNPRRLPGSHYNLTGFLHPAYCDDCLKFGDLVVLDDSKVSFDVTVKHPYPDNPGQTVFDVRGVLLTGTDYIFPASGLSFAFGSGSIGLLNADGYTSPALTDEISSFLQNPADFESSLLPFRAFNTESQRRIFEVTDQDTRTFNLNVPAGPVEFGFVIEACWSKPYVETIVNPQVDFPPEANCSEPCQIEVELDEWPGLNETSAIRVWVYDHQGEDTVGEVTVECPGMFEGIVVLEKDLSCGCSVPVFEGTLTNTLGGQDGRAPILIIARGNDEKNSQGSNAAYQVVRSLADAGREDFQNSQSSQASGSLTGAQLLAGYESDPSQFRESRIGDLIVLWKQQTIGNGSQTATVEHAQKVYQFNADTGELFKEIDTWRHDLPDALPEIIPQQEVETYVEDGINSVELFYMSESSDVFPIDFILDPFYVIKTENDRMFLINAVSGDFLGNGIPPPSGGYAFSGPQYANPCSGTWTSWYLSAESNFENYGYPTDTDAWPDKSVFQTYVQDDDVPLIYEFGHGGSTYFYNGCNGGTSYQGTSAGNISTWISGYNKKSFAFLGHCAGMCSTGSGTLSFAFRKGSYIDTATAGYCHMDAGYCSTCWTYSIIWQNAFFGYMEDRPTWSKYTIYDAFQLANADYPMCGDYHCMRFAGDQNYTLPMNYAIGHLCEDCEDCESGWCEGSLNHPARCGLFEPPEDCWIGGGDTPGCGEDPASEFYDFYFDTQGNLQFEITSTYSCDFLDICDGPEKTDYYVVKDTNTCASNSWTQSEDGWYGGGDEPGCGEDPVGEYREFYIDEFGQEQYIVTDTFSCDIYDDCIPPEITDYFVVENTNTCDSKTWFDGDPDGPVLDMPYDGYQFILGKDLHFKWHQAPGTDPEGYWFRIYHDGELFDQYGADPVNGFYFYKATVFDLSAKMTETVAADGLWEWEIGAHFGPDKYTDIKWSTRWSLEKHTAGVLLVPDDGIEISLDELFEWEPVTGAENYVAKITGLLPGGAAYYHPLNSNQTTFELSKPYYDSLKPGEYTWSIAGTTYFTNDQKLLGSLSYSESVRSFHK